MSTLQVKQDARDHIVKHVLGLMDDVLDTLDQAGCDNYMDLLTFEKQDFNELKYFKFGSGDDEKPITRQLSRMAIIKLASLRPFHHAVARSLGQKSLNAQQWIDDVDKDLYNEYRTNPNEFASRYGNTATSTPGPATTAPVKKTPAETFAASIKRDPNSYPEFKDSKFWDVFNQQLVAQATLHGVINVLDKHYVPSTAEEIALFEVHKNFLYSVFLTKIKQSDAKNLVRDNKDPQVCYEKLVLKFEKSKEAALSTKDIKNKILALRLDKSWNSSSSAFLTHYEKLLLQWEDLIQDPNERWTDTMKKDELSNAVEPHEDLGKIIMQDELRAATGDTVLMYQQYKALLTTMAAHSDCKTQANSSTKCHTIKKGEWGGKGKDQNKKDKDKGKGHPGKKDEDNVFLILNKDE